MKRGDPPYAQGDWIAQDGDAGRTARVREVRWSHRWGDWVADVAIFDRHGAKLYDREDIDLLDYCRTDPPAFAEAAE